MLDENDDDVLDQDELSIRGWEGGRVGVGGVQGYITTPTPYTRLSPC